MIEIFEALFDFIGRNIQIIITVLIIITAASFFNSLSARAVRKLIKKTTRPDMFKSKRDEELRENTIIGIINTTVKVIIWTFATLLILAQMNINLAPLFAGAGIAGVALGFGAQSLVKDMITGMFILLENQYRVGDVVELNKEVSGTVEDFSLRTTVLRDLDGMQHHIPNGEITLATNMTVDFANINLNVGIAYDSDIDKVEKVVNKIGDDLAADEQWSEYILETPQFLRVNELGDSAIIIKITGTTQPMMQWSVTGELRKRIKQEFDKNGIEIPFPQRVIHQVKG